MKICFLYGGQGSQQMGMGKDFYENFSTFQKFYDGIDIDFDLKEYSFNKSNEEISQTRYTQPLMIAFQIGITKLLAEKNIKPDITGGLSIGEYSCLYASNILTDKDAMKIAQKRGIAMTNSTDIPCKMVAIIGYDENEIKNICSKVSSENKYPVEISNLNCPSQVVIAGEKNSVDKVIKILKENNVRKIIELNVSSAFHTSYMQKASIELKEIFKEIKFNSPTIPLGLNIDASIYTEKNHSEEKIKNIMVEQVKNTVYFEKELKNIIAQDVDVFLEIGFSSTIKGFLKKIDRNLNIYEVYSVDTFNNFVNNFINNFR